MIRIFAASLIALGGLAATAAAQNAPTPAQDHPVLRAEAMVTGDVVRIGDLVDHAGIIAKIPIFRAPDLGATGTVSADAVVEAVRAHALIGLDTAGISEVTVTRLSRAIAPKFIESRIAQAIASRYALGAADDIALSLDRELRTVNVEPSAKGDVRIDAVNYEPRSGRFDATVELPGIADSKKRLRVSGHVTVTMEVVTLARALNRGETIKQEDLILQRRPRVEATVMPVTDIHQAVGFAARTTLQPGRPLHATDLMKPEIVQRNEAVTIVYQVPGIVLTIRGKATEGGAEGDFITVINEQTKRPVQGVIAGPGRIVIHGVQRVAANTAPDRTP